jgi:hypothetical protein
MVSDDGEKADTFTRRADLSDNLRAPGIVAAEKRADIDYRNPVLRHGVSAVSGDHPRDTIT